jgi:integrase/recombinase XerD
MSGARLFQGPLAADLDEYLTLKRALGRKFITAERVLRHLDRFLGAHHREVEDLSASIIEAWLSASPALKPQSAAARLSVVRQFCLYRQRTHPHAFVPDPQRDASFWPVHVPRQLPFIFTTEQIRDLLRAALALRPTPGNPLRPKAMFIFLLLLYTAGLRFSEASHLTIGDIDVHAGTLRIRDTKFFKTRLVPLAPDVVDELRAYLELRQAASTTRGNERRLLANARDTPYANSTIRQASHKLLSSIGLEPAPGRRSATLRDVRHTFAVHRITRWYEQGADVQNLLPALATYMGHKDIRSTQYYATVTSAILSHASQRFEERCAPHPRASS